MTITDRTYRPCLLRPQEVYTPGYSTLATRLMGARTLESHGRFVIPWLQEGQRVLDCGCGPGTITLGLSEQVFPGKVTGIDLHSGQIEQAQRLAFGLEQVNASFRTTNIYSLPFQDASFDLVFSHALFEHLGSPREAVKELRRVLRSDGLIALCSPDWDQFQLDPYPESVRHAIETYRDLQTRNGGNTRTGAHLSTWIQDAGFHVLTEETRLETYESTPQIGDYLAGQLEANELTREAQVLRAWSANPDARFNQAWVGVVGL
jgi:ubiquinone/menaquinone biosynthesis C-methylase UbiE